MYTTYASTYAVSLLVYQLFLIGVCRLMDISPFRSQSIHLFLKIHIPCILLGTTGILNLYFKRRQILKSTKNLFVLIGQSLLASLLGSFVFHLITIFLGAAFFENVLETFLFSCLCSALTVFPLYFLYEGAWELFVDGIADPLDAPNSLVDTVKVIACYTVVGAWFGAVPIPLDWDRDWQNWPITCCAGAICGNMIGCVVVLLKCCGLFERFLMWKKKMT